MLKKFFAQPLFKDSKAILLLVAGLLLAFVHTVDFSLNIRSNDLKVPIRYSGYNQSLSDTGQWFSLLTLMVFGISVLIINTAISFRVYHLKKALAITLLGLNIVIMIFLIFVSRALLNAQP